MHADPLEPPSASSDAVGWPECDLIWVGVPADDALDHTAECERLLQAATARSARAPLHSLRFASAGLTLHSEGYRCYNRFRLREAFKLMGCKLQSARAGPDELTERVFETLRRRLLSQLTEEPHAAPQPEAPASVGAAAPSGDSCEQSPRGVAAVLSRTDYLELVLDALLDLHYSSVETLVHFCIASDLKERRRCMILLFGGTSGSGKSTLASLMASRLGISTVLSTDSIRNLLRASHPAAEPRYACLHKSTYTAGEAIELPPNPTHKQRVLRGYKAQAALLRESIERVVAMNVSIIMEGVHLDVRFIMQLLARHPVVIPFLIYISNEQKHRERFAVRSKYMTLEPLNNRYVEHLDAIRTIQRYLVKHADNCRPARGRRLLPKVDNTNVDRSVATIHSTLLRCLARTGCGASLYDPVRSQVVVMNQVFNSHRREVAWSSKAMLRVIKAKVEKRELFDRLFNTPARDDDAHADGSAAAAAAPGASAADAADSDAGADGGRDGGGGGGGGGPLGVPASPELGLGASASPLHVCGSPTHPPTSPTVAFLLPAADARDAAPAAAAPAAPATPVAAAPSAAAPAAAAAAAAAAERGPDDLKERPGFMSWLLQAVQPAASWRPPADAPAEPRAAPLAAAAAPREGVPPQHAPAAVSPPLGLASSSAAAHQWPAALSPAAVVAAAAAASPAAAAHAARQRRPQRASRSPAPHDSAPAARLPALALDRVPEGNAAAPAPAAPEEPAGDEGALAPEGSDAGTVDRLTLDGLTLEDGAEGGGEAEDDDEEEGEEDEGEEDEEGEEHGEESEEDAETLLSDEDGAPRTAISRISATIGSAGSAEGSAAHGFYHHRTRGASVDTLEHDSLVDSAEGSEAVSAGGSLSLMSAAALSHTQAEARA